MLLLIYLFETIAKIVPEFGVEIIRILDEVQVNSF
jgi:hypothetical protein